MTLIRREIEHAEAGRPCGIKAKMNQLQDPSLVRELYAASRAGVPVSLNVRGLCILKPGVPGLSETIRVFSVLGRFLEHGRIYRFENDGEPEIYIGSADWMKRNLDGRVETMAPVTDPALKSRSTPSSRCSKQRQPDRVGSPARWEICPPKAEEG